MSGNRVNKIFSDIIDLMYELDEYHLKLLFADALKYSEEQNVCMRIGKDIIKSPQNQNDILSNRQIKDETKKSLKDIAEVSDLLKNTNELQRAATQLAMNYNMKVPFIDKRYEVDIVQTEVSPKEYIEKNYPNVKYEDAYKEYLRVMKMEQ